MVSRPWQSHAPDAIDDLVTYLKAAIAPFSDVMVQDGPFVTADALDDVIVVGWAGFPTGITRPATQMQEQLGGADVSAVGVQEGLGPSILETMLISCGSLGRDGSQTAQSNSNARRTAYSYVTLVGQILAAHQLAGQPQIGHIMQAVTGTSTSLHQAIDRRGSLAVVTFNIEARAYAQQ
jgi:hypothetical protein